MLSSARIARVIVEAISNIQKVKELVRYDKLVVQDLDELAEEDEVIEVISRLVETEPTHFTVCGKFEGGQKNEVDGFVCDPVRWCD